MKPVNLNAKYTLHFTYGIKHGRGHLILLHHFSVMGFFLASSHLCAEIPPHAHVRLCVRAHARTHTHTHTHMQFYAKEV